MLELRVLNVVAVGSPSEDSMFSDMGDADLA